MIHPPVSYSLNSQQLVDDYEKDKTKHVTTYWSEEEIKDLKEEIKEYYKVIQKFTCVYCNKKFPVKHSAVWDIEHIIAREKAPYFMFTPENLCVACKDCNGTKRNQDVLKYTPKNEYPQETEKFIILHPHFDIYEEHIAIYLDKVYSPKSSKGQKTIEMCGLLRFAYQEVGWDEAIANMPDILEIAEKLLSEEDDEVRKILEMELVMKAQVKLSSTLLSINIRKQADKA